MNITEANHVNTVLKALLQQEFGTSVDDAAARLTLAACALAQRAHTALNAGLTADDVANLLAAPEPLPVLGNLVDLHGAPVYNLAENVVGVFVCYEGGHVGFLADQDQPDWARIVAMLSDAAVAVVRAAGIDPDAVTGGQ